jgi:hypothetical protein
MFAVTVAAVVVTAIAFISCTVMGIKMVMDKCTSSALYCISLGAGNLVLCVGNIMRLVIQTSGA